MFDFVARFVYYLVMALSSLIVYEPLDNFTENRTYWSEYVSFYEQYWGGPTSPYGVWFGTEYDNFRRALSNHLEIDDYKIQDCFSMKDKNGKYYIAPFSSGTNPHILNSENHIPFDWFLLFKSDEREYFYTPWGFGGINYDTKINLATERLNDAREIIDITLKKQKENHFKVLIFEKLIEIQSGIAGTKTWLGGFDPRAYIVLNYGEICSFIHPYTMKNERSVSELWQLIDFIKEDRFEEAQSALSILTEKWDDIRRKAIGEVEKFTIQ